MNVNRADFLYSLSRVWPVVGTNQLVPEYMAFHFHGTSVQATDGAMWIDSPLPKGVDLQFSVKAAPIYQLLQRIKDDNVELELVGEPLKKLVVRTGKVESEFEIKEPKTVPIPEGLDIIEIPNLTELVRGLDFCHYGASKDEALGALCGVFIDKDMMLGCDRFRILQWKLEKPVNLKAIISTKMIELLNHVKDQIRQINYKPNEGEFTGGTIRVSLEGGAEVWGLTHVGQYRDLTAFIPATSSAVKMALSSDFPEVLDRHLTLLKDVPPVDKELTFLVKGEKVVTSSSVKVGTEVTRRLKEETTIKGNGRTEEFGFSVNPSLLLDAMGKCWEFAYFPDCNLVLFESEQFKYLVQTRG